MLLGVDVGGTFTDAVLAAGGRLYTGKAPTTPDDQSEGVLDAVRSVLEQAGARGEEVSAFAHGTTVATNALLEGRSARTVLVTTEGFEDVVELGRQARADLYRLCAAHPAPLVPPERRVGARERTVPDGVLQPLEGLAALVDRVAAHEPDAVAVCLLHSYAHPGHEQAIGDALRERLPDVHVSLSHEVVGTFREYERAATTEIDAALSPLLAAYLQRLASRAAEAGLPEPALMQSSGGLASLGDAAAHAAVAVLSGPAGGAAGAAWAARSAGFDDALCFDMGGTSCDVCVIEGGAVREAAGRPVGGRPVALPMLDLHTVGAGGGSVAWRDAGGALRVGPRSAGARPGPAAYGLGATEPTVTDANVVLGYVRRLAGGLELDRGAALAAVESLGLGSAEEAAHGIRRVANAEMVRALRVMTVERGVDPRGMALLAFGGAGPLHAAAIAEELDMSTVLCPRAAGVLAALGLVVSERRRDVQRSVLTTDLDAAPAVAELAARARAELGHPEAPVRAVADLRYRGQSFELTVPVGGDLRAAFETAHEERYGFRDPEGEVELVNLRVTAAIPGPTVMPEVRAHPAPDGPGVIELPESTVLVPAGWRASVDAAGNVRLDR